MSSRWYPIYARGNPQLRIFLPNLWMKLVRNKNMKSPPNKVTFEVSPEMTRLDVKNYLEKIYQVPVLSVNTKIVSGRTDYFRHNNAFRELYKEPDIKYAYVTLPKDAKFEYPDVTVQQSENEAEKKSEEDVAYEKSLKQMSKEEALFRHKSGTSGGRKSGIPTFFGH